MHEALEGLYFLLSDIPGLESSRAEKFTTVSEIETLDLLSEGPIEGPTSGYYTFSGNFGEIGYQTASWTPYASAGIGMGVYNSGELIPAWARSIYYNGVPIINSSGLLNFTNIDISWTRGNPTGSSQMTVESTQFLSRIINEVLRQTNITGINLNTNTFKLVLNPHWYPDNLIDWLKETPSSIGQNKTAQKLLELGKTLGSVYKVWPTQLVTNLNANFADNIKVYKILNKECIGVVINLKIAALSSAQTDVGGQDIRFTQPLDKEKHYEMGNIGNYTVYLGFSYRPIFQNENDSRSQWVRDAKTLAITGRISYGALFPVRLDFEDADTRVEQSDFVGWEVLIFRITTDAYTTPIQSTIYIDSLSELYRTVMTFPYSAIIRSRFSAEYFSQIPERAFKTKLLKVKIPARGGSSPIYNPALRTYDESPPWDGTFTTEKYWSNNPVWCYYDLLTNRRYGLGRYIEESSIDKWTLYEIAKYCDALVYDTYGNLEPRFTFNWWFTTREDAYKVLSDLTSVFRAMIYYGFGTIYTVQDSPKTSFYTFTNANIEDGNFTYSSTNRRDRHTVAIIRYNDPNNMYKPALEYVEDVDGIRKYGIREVEFTAFGCSSRGQAIRLGRWALLSETLETELITFVAGYEATMLRPGDIFGVFDANRKGHRYAGRTEMVTDLGAGLGTTFVLDGEVTGLHDARLYTLELLTPTYYYPPTEVTIPSTTEAQQIRRSPIQKFFFTGGDITNTSNHAVLTITGKPDTGNYSLINNMIWNITVPSGYDYPDENWNYTEENVDYYRAIRITEKEEGKYEIGGVQYAADKFAQIESGIGYAPVAPKTVITPNGPSSLVPELYDNGSITYIKYTITLPDLSGVSSLYVYISSNGAFGSSRPDSQYLANVVYKPTTTYVDYYLPSIDDVTYWLRAYTKNDIDDVFSSSYAEGSIYYEGGFDITSVYISHLNIVGATSEKTDGKKIISDSYDPTFTWQVHSSNATVPFETDIPCRITIRAPTYVAGAAISSEVYYEVSGIVPTNGEYLYTFFFNTNLASTGGPHRDYDIVVEAHDSSGNTSAGNVLGIYTSEQYASYPGRYDIGTFVNAQQTGIEFGSGIPTPNYSGGPLITGSVNHITTQWLGPNGEVVIVITSGYLSEDLEGGFIYISSGTFPKQEAIMAATGSVATPATGNLYVYRYQFKDFNPSNAYIYHPTAGMHIRGLETGYFSVSFYDTVGAALLEDSMLNATGLYLSNNAIITNQPHVGTIAVSETIAIREAMATKSATDIKMINYGTTESPIYRLVSLDNLGNETIITSNIVPP